MQTLCLPVGELDTNCYLIWDAQQRAAVIDPGGEADRILEAVRREKLSVEAVLLTHVHFDHMLAAPCLLKETGARLLLPETDAPALADDTRSLLTWLYPRPELQLSPDRLLRNGDRLTVGGLVLQVLHTPGHTPGSSCYLCEGTLFCGDLLFARSMGRTDFPDGDPEAMRQSLAAVAALEGNLRLCPGHGPETTLEQERRENPYLRACMH